ncbi:bifunctional riboflavin kinase/FAD synthetase [Microbacterium pseudoresistens]|uniref:Riboflavin biosynthesis protein n=1 Tax=Microbacterium pseudoresistens TaxID=640634 RepID=A0A7Y9JPX0_9MICO|nr:bifunctional riboflavin kinase/FAD synthetase [Microbacterium pseudoresistens]NYD55104.1 riboflavin kinase/FMN adenylyltransferase [Microbacterium pseudoresistens]
MIVYRDITEIPEDAGAAVVAIGKFDGVHAAHCAVFARAKQDAAARGARTVAVTFDRNPLSVLSPDKAPDSLVTLDRKLELLAQEGIDAVLVLTFDEQLAQVEASEFVQTILVDALRAVVVLVGRDFRFGRGGAGDPALLERMGAENGFSVDVVDDVFLDGSARRVSSTWVRELLASGDVTTAAEVLGRPVSVRGEIVHGLKRGRELGFPTANLEPTLNAMAPADGVYAGWLIDHTTGVRHPAAISVGTNPTFDDVAERQVEAHVIDREGLDLYGHDATVEFAQRLRGMTAFHGIEALKATMADDVARTRSVLSGAPASETRVDG